VHCLQGNANQQEQSEHTDTITPITLFFPHLLVPLAATGLWKISPTANTYKLQSSDCNVNCLREANFCVFQPGI